MTFIRSLIFNAVFFGSSIPIVLLLTLTLPFPRPVLKRGLELWMHWMVLSLRLFAGLTIEVRGRQNIPDGPAVFASKHQSAWDTGVFFVLTADPAYVLKKELLHIPFYGWLLRKDGMVAIDRSAGASALKQMVRDSRRILGDGRQLVIFPEGTRSAPGSKQPYHPGIAAIYKQTDAPVVPVALDSGLYWARRSFIKKPGTIVIEFLKPMEPGMDRKTFMRELERRVEEKTDSLIAEATDGRG